MTTRAEIQAIVDQAVTEIGRILTAPWPSDPAAPSGHLHAEVAEREIRKRCRAAIEVARALPRTVGERYGPAVEATMTEAVEELVATIESKLSGPPH